MLKKLLYSAIYLTNLLSITNVSTAWPKYGSTDCQPIREKISVTLDYQDVNFNTRLFYTESIIYKYNNYKAPYAGNYEIKSKSTTCPDFLNPCFFRSHWAARAGAIYVDFAKFSPGVTGKHYWKKPNGIIEQRSSHSKKCTDEVGGLKKW